MADPFVGEIRMAGFNFAPQGWAFCDGSILPISQFQALFSVIGTTYGGDGQRTIGLPNLLGRVPIGQGSSYPLGQVLGEENIILTTDRMPVHSHGNYGLSSIGSSTSPTGNHLAEAPVGLGNVYNDSQDHTSGNLLANTGSNLAHENRAPYLAINFIISLFGVFPSRS
jgi:microcystin-dependent protein